MVNQSWQPFVMFNSVLIIDNCMLNAHNCIGSYGIVQMFNIRVEQITEVPVLFRELNEQPVKRLHNAVLFL